MPRPTFEALGLLFGAGVLLNEAPRLFTRAPTSAPLAPALPAWVWLTPAAAAVLAFGWAIVLGPLSDDYVLRQWAQEGRLVPAEWPFVRPLPLAVWRALGILGGDWTALHVVNVAGHAVNSGLVATIGAALLGPARGTAAGVAFGLFPASTEAVAWTAGVFDVLATTAVLVAATAWVRMTPSRTQQAVVLVAAVAGLLCKESAVVLPVLLVLLLAAQGPAATVWWKHSRTLATSVALTAGFVAWRAVSTDHLQQLPVGRRAWKDLLVRPFAAAAVPVRDTEIAAAAIISLAVLGLAGLGLARARATQGPQATFDPRRVAFAGLAWTLVAALPLLSQFIVTGTLEGSRYLYLASAGFALALASVPGGTRARTTVSWVLLATLAGQRRRTARPAPDSGTRGRLSWARQVRDDAPGDGGRQRRAYPGMKVTGLVPVNSGRKKSVRGRPFMSRPTGRPR